MIASLLKNPASRGQPVSASVPTMKIRKMRGEPVLQAAHFPDILLVVRPVNDRARA